MPTLWVSVTPQNVQKTRLWSGTPASWWLLRTTEVMPADCQHQLDFGHHCAHPLHCAAHSSSVEVVSATLLPTTCNSHHWLFLPKEENSPESRHWISSSFSIIYQLHPGPWVKTIPQLLSFSRARNNPHCLSQSLTTGALSPPRLCRGSVWAGLGQLGVPLVLTNQVPSGQTTSRTQRVQTDFWCSHQKYRDQNSCLLCLFSLFEILTLIMVDVLNNDFTMHHKFMPYYFNILKLVNIYFGHLVLKRYGIHSPWSGTYFLCTTNGDCQMLNERIWTARAWNEETLSPLSGMKVNSENCLVRMWISISIVIILIRIYNTYHEYSKSKLN